MKIKYPLANSPIDKEALKRNSKYYLHYKTIDMLPRKLVDICSLKAGKERLTYSVYIKV